MNYEKSASTEGASRHMWFAVDPLVQMENTGTNQFQTELFSTPPVAKMERIPDDLDHIVEGLQRGF